METIVKNDGGRPYNGALLAEIDLDSVVFKRIQVELTCSDELQSQRALFVASLIGGYTLKRDHIRAEEIEATAALQPTIMEQHEANKARFEKREQFAVQHSGVRDEYLRIFTKNLHEKKLFGGERRLFETRGAVLHELKDLGASCQEHGYAAGIANFDEKNETAANLAINMTKHGYSVAFDGLSNSYDGVRRLWTSLSNQDAGNRLEGATRYEWMATFTLHKLLDDVTIEQIA